MRVKGLGLCKMWLLLFVVVAVCGEQVNSTHNASVPGSLAFAGS